MALYYCNLLKFKQFPNCFVKYGTRLSHDQKYKRCYEILEIPENSDYYEIRKAYLLKVKQFHPDSSAKNTNVNKFHEVDEAFRTLIDKKARERWDVEDLEKHDTKHVVPQHRQYLNYEGVGYGNPYQREKQYLKMRTSQASENLLKHRVAKVTTDENTLVPAAQQQKHDIKTKSGIDRLVEDLIQEAMSTGKFNNLSGCGKPLRDVKDTNPYVDFVTHKLNEILIQNGFTPEWITLQKEIREDLQAFRNSLFVERTSFSPYPLTVQENIKWSDVVYRYKTLVDDINKKINNYNLLVPILDRQMLHVSILKEAQRILIKGKTNKDVIDGYSKKINEEPRPPVTTDTIAILSFIEMLFKRSD